MIAPASMLEKHRRIKQVICCPCCKADLRFADAVTLEMVPLVSDLVCPGCGLVGQVANFKYLFNNRVRAHLDFPPGDLKGGLTVADLDFTSSQFSPAGNWTTDAVGLYCSAEKGATFSVASKGSLAIALNFLKHPWSGLAKICVDGSDWETIDLFEEAGSMRLWYPIYLGTGDHLVTVENMGLKHPKSKDAQVCLDNVEVLDLNEAAPNAISYASQNNGNPYPGKFADLMAACGEDALVLDCGSGDRSYPDPRVVNFEYSMFRSPDVFGDGHSLPFKDDSFDLILSQAVIEHLHTPELAVAEMYRCLKPGGKIYCESAFMQPLHAVPYHFFNTTPWGIEWLFRQFEILESSHNGTLAQSVEWFYRLTSLREKGLGHKVDKVVELVRELDADISHEELKQFASYVELLAVKQELAGC